jgi:hypothetical protein
MVLVLVSIKLLAPIISNANQEKYFWDYYRRLSKLRVEENNTEELKRYLEAISYSESRGNPEAWNKHGYIGKYQFGFITRKSCGYGYIRFTDFVRNPSIWSEEDQEKAMITLLSKNEDHLREIIRRYNGEVIKGVTITKSGILAAAHLAGAGGVQRYFSNGNNPEDACGTTLEDYLFKFSGFNI